MSSDGTCVLIALPSAHFSASKIQHEQCNSWVFSLSFSLDSLLSFQCFKHYKRNTLLIVLWTMVRLLIVLSWKSEMKTQLGLEQVRAASSLNSQENRWWKPKQLFVLQDLFSLGLPKSLKSKRFSHSDWYKVQLHFHWSVVL